MHAGRDIDPTTGAVSPPVYLTTTFERDAEGGYARGFGYLRDAHPNQSALEECMNALEGAAVSAAFGSGTAAALALFSALPTGSHILFSHDCYHGTAHQLRELIGRLGHRADPVDTTDPAAVAAAWEEPTRLLWLETPSNPMLRVSDITALADLAHANGAELVCDNTLATPVLQRPLSLGADWVVHSATKYLGGHSDVSGGVVLGRSGGETFDRIRQHRSMGGAVLAPFDAWLLLRSVATLPLRIHASSRSATRLATELNAHPAIAAVHYPGLETHPGHTLAKRQMLDFGAVLSIQVRGSAREAMAVAARVGLFTRATSLGAVESLIEHRASIEGSNTTTPDNLLRLSIGVEHVDDLFDDIVQALEVLVA